MRDERAKNLWYSTPGMTNVRLSLPAVIAIVVIASAAAFAAGRSFSPAQETASPVHEAPPQHQPDPGELPPGHPPAGGTGAMPPGHPPIDDPMSKSAPPSTAAAEGSYKWTVPSRWKEAPNASAMRLATYKIPGPDGEAEVSVSQAGGSIEANATRWIGQFDSASQKSAKQSTKKIAGFDVTIVEVQGNYTGGMSGDGGANMALLGAIIATPGMAHFFKITGPVKTVTGARAELDQLLASFAQKS
jgi:hypothetical protein